MRFLAIGLILCAAQAAAQDGLRDGDVSLTEAELTALLSDKVLEFYTDGLATYRADGGYDYRYSADGEPIPGAYEVRENSMVCTVFINGFERCDYLVLSGGRYVLVIENGERYPVRSVTALE